MSRRTERDNQSDVSAPADEVEELRQSPEFRGPVEPLDVHAHGDEGSNDHLASIYDSREQQFAAAIPFVREGLERGERCLYIADDNSREEVLDAMRAAEIDVDAALESGALSVHTKADTYLRTGEFDRDAMLAFWEDTLEQETEEGDYAGVRAAAEMTWALEEGTGLDLLVEYEAVLNHLFSDEDYVVLCQYNRDRFPAEVIRDVVRTHPYLIHGDAILHNHYYRPPEEFFGPDRPDREIDQMLGTLRERTAVKTELRERQRYLRRAYEIAADADGTFEEKLDALFELGCERFDLELGGIARIDPESDLFEVEAVNGDHEQLKPGARVALSETYCRVFADRTDVTGITDPLDDGFKDTLAYEEFGVRTYLGTRIELSEAPDRTLFFVSSEPRDEPFSEAERTFHHLMAQWVQYELEHEHREAQLERKNDRLESFASMLAHELRNPVTIGQIYSQKLPDGTDSEAVEYVAEAFDRIENMVDVMLVLTRGHEAVGECIPVRLADAGNEAWDDVDAPDASLEVAVSRTIRADETYVRHLFRNLFENAVEHGGADVTVTVGDLPTGFYVEDDGVGIPASERERIFEAGYTTTSDKGGTGLGLAFVQELADVYDWEHEVTESESGGARFEFRNVDRNSGDD